MRGEGILQSNNYEKWKTNSCTKTPPMIVKYPKQLDQSETEVDTEQKYGDQPRLRSSNGKHLEVEKGDKPVARDPTPLIPYLKTEEG